MEQPMAYPDDSDLMREARRPPLHRTHTEARSSIGVVLALGVLLLLGLMFFIGARSGGDAPPTGASVPNNAPANAPPASNPTPPERTGN